MILLSLGRMKDTISKERQFLIQAITAEKLRERQHKGLAIARKCASILKEQFGAHRVVVFGSMLNLDLIWWGSAIELAVWGLPVADLSKAEVAIGHSGVLRTLDEVYRCTIDLVEVQHDKPHILRAIVPGVEL